MDLGDVGSFEGKSVVITGAAQGLGAAIARCLHGRGASVLLSDVNIELGEELAADLGEGATFVPLDVSDETAWDEVARIAEQAFGGVDGLVNNAGVLVHGPMLSTTVAEYLHAVSVNQLGCFLGMRTFTPLLQENGGGAIVNMSSALGVVGMADFVVYSATKFAVRGMTKAAAAELGPLNIRVNSVHPTGVRTPMSDPAKFGRADRPTNHIPLRRLSDAHEVARLVAFLCSDESSYCTGAEFVIDGGVLAQQRN